VIHVYLGKSNNSFSSSTPTVPNLYFSDVALADLNKDGKLDIVAGATDQNTNTQVDVMLGHGDGTFAAATQTLIAGGQADPAPVLAVADFDGDGNPDVAFFLAGDFSGVLFGAGDGSLPTQVKMPIFSPVFPGAARAADLNGDGKPDLMFADANISGVVSMINQWGLAGGGVSGAKPDFAIAVAPTAGSVGAGASAMATVTLTPSGGFSGTVALACSGAPTGATCRFSPSSVSLSGAADTSVLTIGTAPSVAKLMASPQRSRLDPFTTTGMVLAGMLAPLTMRRRRRRSRTARAFSWLGLLLICGAALHGCGGGGGSSGKQPMSGGTPAGTYTVTVTATSGSTSHAATYSLTVT
jgi:hypothetical protein